MWRNTVDTYGLVAVLLHWLIAAVVVGLFALGLWMVELTYYDTCPAVTPARFHLPGGTHSAGLTQVSFDSRLRQRKPAMTTKRLSLLSSAGACRCAGPRRASEVRTGVVCLGAQSVVAGDKLWEEKHPEVAEALWVLARAHAQQDPSLRTSRSFTRLAAAEALAQLRAQGFADALLPSPSTMAAVLNRNGYRLRPVLKAKPQKNSGNRCHLREHPRQGAHHRRRRAAIEHRL